MADRPYIVKCSKCGVAIPKETTEPFVCHFCKPEVYPRSFYRNRKIAFKRDKYKCQCCGTKEHILAHHLDCDKKNNKILNLITLCLQCHFHLHGNYSHKTLRRSNIYKLFPKFILFGEFGKRFKPLEKVPDFVDNTKRFYKTDKEGKKIRLKRRKALLVLAEAKR